MKCALVCFLSTGLGVAMGNDVDANSSASSIKDEIPYEDEMRAYLPTS